MKCAPCLAPALDVIYTICCFQDVAQEIESEACYFHFIGLHLFSVFTYLLGLWNFRKQRRGNI